MMSFCLLTTIYAQDVILTQDNNFFEGEIISMLSEKTFIKVTGQDSISMFDNADIKAFKWSSKNLEEVAFFDSKTTIDLSQGTHIIEKKKNEKSKQMALASAGLFGAMFIVLNKAEELSNDEDELLGGFALGLFGVCFAIAGMGTCLHSLTSLNRTTYKLIPVDDTKYISNYQEVTRLKQREQAKNAYLSASKQGLGLQLNF